MALGCHASIHASMYVKTSAGNTEYRPPGSNVVYRQLGYNIVYLFASPLNP